MNEAERSTTVSTDGEFVCKCECGGNVLGVREFGRLFTWCTECTPITKVCLKGGSRDYHNGT
jgi:hypothetical protein